MNDRELERILGGADFSRGTEAFAERLLSQALEVLGSESVGIDLADEQLEMLSAAGDIYAREDEQY